MFRHEAFAGSRVRGGTDGAVSGIGGFVRIGRATRQIDRQKHTPVFSLSLNRQSLIFRTLTTRRPSPDRASFFSPLELRIKYFLYEISLLWVSHYSHVRWANMLP